MTTILSEILSAEINESVNEIGYMTVQVRRSLLPEDIETVHEIAFYREGEGLIFVGYRGRTSTTFDEAGVGITSMEIWGREVELKWLETHRAKVVLIDATTQQGLNAILDGSGWTGVVEGTGYPGNVTKRFDDHTRLSALLEYAKLRGGYLRFNRANREVVLSNEPPLSGITIAQTPASGSHDAASIATVEELVNDPTDIFNRVTPEGKVDGNEIFTLADGTRNSPYSRQTMIPGPANITEGQGSGGVSADVYPKDMLTMPAIESSGVNKMTLAIVHCDRGSSDSVVMTAYRDDALAGSFGLGQQTAGQTLQLFFDSFIPPSPIVWKIGHNLALTAVGLHAYVLTIQDFRRDLIAPTPARSTGTGTSITESVTPGSTFAGSFWLDIVAYEGTATATPTSGQEILYNELSPSFTGRLVVARKPLTVGVANTLNWTLGSSQTWVHIAVRIMPAQSVYIEDTASQAKYGLRETHLQLGDYRTNLAPVGLTAAANSMYDRAVDALLKGKDPKLSYKLRCDWWPYNMTQWEVGSKARVRFAKDGEEIDDLLVVPSRTQRFDRSGIRYVDVEVSNLNHFRGGLLADMVDAIETIQKAQV